ncbi:hypothetical protein MAUB1S_02681 [Mycolicibacterium aubagnense]
MDRSGDAVRDGLVVVAGTEVPKALDDVRGWCGCPVQETTLTIRFWLIAAVACGLGIALFYSEWLSAAGV